MKNGIAMISNFSMPVKSFSATDSSGTCVIVNRKVSTVRPSAIEIGMPVSISARQQPEDDEAGHGCAPGVDVSGVQVRGQLRPLGRVFLVEALDVAVVGVRQVRRS